MTNTTLNITRKFRDDLDDLIDNLRLLADRIETHQKMYKDDEEEYNKYEKARREMSTAIQLLYTVIDYLKS
jgi:hypothetical protein